METTTKICTKCKIEKSITEFNKKKDTKDGLKTHCRECCRYANKQRYQDKTEEILSKNREYHNKNKEVISAQRKEYRENNTEKIKEEKRLFYQNNKEKISSQKKERYEKNREVIIIERRKQYQSNIEEMRKRDRKRYQDNKELFIIRSRRYRNTPKGKISKLNSEHKRRAIKKDGDVSNKQLGTLYSSTKTCYWCNAKLMKGDIHLDHYTPLSKGGLHTISNLVLSCSKCNLKKSAKDPLLFAQEMGRLL